MIQIKNGPEVRIKSIVEREGVQLVWATEPGNGYDWLTSRDELTATGGKHEIDNAIRDAQ